LQGNACNNTQVGRPRGRTPSILSQKRRMSSITAGTGGRRESASVLNGRRTSASTIPGTVRRNVSAASQPSMSDESSSGSEDEEQIKVIIASPSPAKKVRYESTGAQQRAATAAAAVDLIAPLHNGGVVSVADDATGDSARRKELEEELRTSKEREKFLEVQLVDAKKKLLEAFNSDKSGIRAANAQRALQHAMQEKESLRLEKEQLERRLQEAYEQRKQDASMAQQELQRLQLELRQRDNTIQKLQRQHANSFRLGEGTDFV
jgi:hypothetical protein